ncbi:glycosyltransferase family 2 protein [Pseudooceanicola aestuarii]|uniref:glycosyltransferase family 2 protein n=1 Tax=Pseudooceanicola aestuarii TaxID=2697319 RepID=UPI0013D626F7|nr:glycosyltransferase [Pseudooceanicola aestuarii]
MSNAETLTPPLITVGLTCFNARETVQVAFDSAVAQDWPRVEIVVVDDCSCDGSDLLLMAAAAGRDNVRLIRHSRNLGAAVARNTILRHASGTWLAFFDDDDISHPARLRLQLAHLLMAEAQGLPVLSYASGRRRYDNGYEKPLPAIGSRGRGPQGCAVADYLLFNQRDPAAFYGAGTPTCALMARTRTLRDLAGFDPALRRVEDVDLAIRAALAGVRLVGCPADLFLQRATTAPDKSADRNFVAERALVEKHADYLRGRGMLSYSRAWLQIRHCHFSGKHGALVLRICLFLLRYPRRGLRHLVRSGPARLAHERRLRAGVAP